MNVFRLSKGKYKNQLSGVGASMYGGRWNSPGTEIIYTAANRSLAMAEILVHLEPSQIPDDYFMLTIAVPGDFSILRIEEKELPSRWNAPIIYHTETKKMGDQFIRENKFGFLKVPSAVTKSDFNFLINPFYDRFSEVKIMGAEPFPFDGRFFR